MASADEECGVCGKTRDAHGDMQHQFNMDGQLILVKPAEPPREEPPKERPGANQRRITSPYGGKLGVEGPDTNAAMLRLLEILVTKGIVDGHDVIKVLGG